MSANAMLLGFTVPEVYARELFSIDSRPAIQTHKFAWSMARSLRIAFGKVVLASVAPMQSYPLGKKLFARGGSFEVDGIDGVMLPYINIILLKHLTRFLSCLFVFPWIVYFSRVRYIFVHGVHTPFLLVGLLARVFGLRFYVILTDPPGVALPSDTWLSRILKRVDVVGVRVLLRFAHGAISLSPELLRQYAESVPALVFPGVLSSDFVEKMRVSDRALSDKSDFVVVYAGGLNAAYGVDKLLDAMPLLGEFNIKLRIFGRGDQEERLCQLAHGGSNVYYGGFLNDEQLVPELLAADLLINPRPTVSDVSVMSFPSKLIEYLATGRPVLTTRIASIPFEYESCFHYIDDETVLGVKNAILSLYNMDPNALLLHALSAQRFIFDNASEFMVGNRIKHFVSVN